MRAATSQRQVHSRRPDSEKVEARPCPAHQTGGAATAQRTRPWSFVVAPGLALRALIAPFGPQRGRAASTGRQTLRVPALARAWWRGGRPFLHGLRGVRFACAAPPAGLAPAGARRFLPGETAGSTTRSGNDCGAPGRGRPGAPSDRGGNDAVRGQGSAHEGLWRTWCRTARCLSRSVALARVARAQTPGSTRARNPRGNRSGERGEALRAVGLVLARAASHHLPPPPHGPGSAGPRGPPGVQPGP